MSKISSANVSVTGMDAILRRLDEVGKGANLVVNSALKAAAEPILAEARDNVRVNTERLKRSLKIGPVRSKGGVKYIEVGYFKKDYPDAFYAIFQEFGTRKMPAYPFLGPAYENNRKKAQDVLARELRRGMML